MSFAEALGALFDDPVLAKTAEYFPMGSLGGFSVQVIARQPDAITNFGEARLHSETHMFDLLASEVAAPQVGDRFVLGEESYAVQAEPVADSERLVWTLEAVSL